MNETPASPPKKLSRLQRMSAVVGACLVVGLIAAASGGVASAQTVIPAATNTTNAKVAVLQVEGDGSDQDRQDGQDPDGVHSSQDDAVLERWEQCLENSGVDFESEGDLDDAALDAAFEQCDPILDDLTEDYGDLDISPEDEVTFERYDQCLQDAGLDFESDVEPDEAALDAAFEECDPILDDLSEEYFGAEFDGFEGADFGDISSEDQALFEQYEQCLENNGVDFESENDLDDAAFDAAFEQCDPILDELSDAFGTFPDLSDEDQAVYERFEQCLADGGANDLFEADQPDESAIESLFEQCDPILDELSEDAQELLGCPGESEHTDDG